MLDIKKIEAFGESLETVEQQCFMSRLVGDLETLQVELEMFKFKLNVLLLKQAMTNLKANAANLDDILTPFTHGE